MINPKITIYKYKSTTICFVIMCEKNLTCGLYFTANQADYV